MNSSPSSTYRERRPCLTDKGAIVASCTRIKSAVETLDEAEQQRLAVELRNIVARVCAPFLRPVA